MIRRVFVTKKDGVNVSASKMKADIKNVLNIKVEDVIDYIRYDIEGISDENYSLAMTTIFSELPVDIIYQENLPEMKGYKVFVVEFLPGQYDQRADSASQCVQLLTVNEKPLIKCATVIAVKGVTDKELNTIKNYFINPVESREGSTDKPLTLEQSINVPLEVEILSHFIYMSDLDIEAYHKNIGFAMSVEDLIFVRDYFKSEKRPPSITELKVIDTYWSDHCRHTTFLTEIRDIKINSNNPHIAKALDMYSELFDEINAGKKDKYRCLMDIAVIAAKKLVKDGLLDNLDVSEEINACSIVVKVDNNGKDEEWLIMFKNETHNHPTEIEPFGGAATCLGGAIRDPLSGRTYVYQAMRVTGSGDPNESLKDTMKGKLPQRVITTTAKAGFSSYGNQIGLATGIVDEMYHEGYKAKRLETGFVIGGAPRSNVVRRSPIKGDVVVLLGGDTGRDGCGGATGSSKAHTVDSVDQCGAEVQKGNPLTERKMQRLFRNREASRLIVKCNDFGAGGVSVAIGELSDGIDIYLDNVPKKYAGLDGTELAISESQERMAIMLPKENVDKFIAMAELENLKCTQVAEVTDLNRVRMFWNDKCIVNICRDFLNTNGVKQVIAAEINDKVTNYINEPNKAIKKLIDKGDFKSAILEELARLNVTANKGMSETFDSTIGAGTVIMPWGGKHQLTPSTVMAAKVPVSGETDTATVCSYACYPALNITSPFTGAVYAIVNSVSKIVASGVDYRTVRLTLQEFFKRLGRDPKRWGEPLSAVLGALYAQINLGLGAIGGKDSMSGTFENIDVPPTLISFAVGIGKASQLITNVYNSEGNLYLLRARRDENSIPDFDYLKKLWKYIFDNRYHILSASVVEEGGSVVSVIKSALGNGMGVALNNVTDDMFKPSYGDIVILTKGKVQGIDHELIGKVNKSGKVVINKALITHDELVKAYTEKLNKVFPISVDHNGSVEERLFSSGYKSKSRLSIARPKVLLPVFPGTNCEYDTAKRFTLAGADAETFVIRNQNTKDIEYSVKEIARIINDSQIIAFPGGFSGGDEPDGSGKFIATTFRNPIIMDAVMNLLYKRDGLIIGICNGFQALIKLGLVPYGEIIKQNEKSPTLTYNVISRHVSTISRIKVTSNKSPWLNNVKTGDVYSVAISHGEGRFIASEEDVIKLRENGQIATQYVDLSNNITMQSPYNPNGSMNAVEGILSPDGRVFGKMGHSERIGKDLYINVEDNYDMKIFESGVDYYK